MSVLHGALVLFALRRGASAEKMARALVAGRTAFSAGELATVAVARALARIPCELTAAERGELLRVYGPKQAEWIVLGIVMMGFLNKFMNAIGVELEQPVVSEVSTTLGSDWDPGVAGAQLDPSLPSTAAPGADGLSTKLRLLPLLPSALRLDARWQRGVPNRWPAAGTWLRERTGHDFPVLSRLRQRRAVRAAATMLRDNLDPASSVIGLRTKVLAGAVFAETISDAALAGDVRALAATAGLRVPELEAAGAFARGSDEAIGAWDVTPRALLLLSRAASPSPAEITADVIAACREADVSAVAIVELVSWLSVLQMLHRLGAFYTTDARALCRSGRCAGPSRYALRVSERESASREGEEMSRVLLEMSMSLDGYVTGPDVSDEEPMGRGGEVLHEWMFAGRSPAESREWQTQHFSDIGAVIMGRRIVDLGMRFWGEEPVFHAPCFVVTHRAAETIVKKGGTSYIFVTGGVTEALRRAREAAGSKDVLVNGGAEISRQFLHAGLVDEVRLHLVPVALGGGEPLFDGTRSDLGLVPSAAVATPLVTHLTYEVDGP